MLETKPPINRAPAGALPCAWPAEDVLTDWANVIRAEYCEMPGLSLSERQVERLWQLDRQTAEALLKHLTEDGFLRCTLQGAYIRADIGLC